MSGVIGRSEAERLERLTIGDSLRQIADLLDRVPSLILALDYPEMGIDVTARIKSGIAAEGIAEVLGLPVTHRDHEDRVQTTAEARRGRALLRLVASDPLERELRRPPAAPPTPEEDLQLGGEQ